MATKSLIKFSYTYVGRSFPIERLPMCYIHVINWGNIAGYLRGVYISRILKLLRFAELIFAELIENHTHVPLSVATSRVQSSWKFSFCEIRKNIHPSKITRYTVVCPKKRLYGSRSVHYWRLLCLSPTCISLSDSPQLCSLCGLRVEPELE